MEYELNEITKKLREITFKDVNEKEYIDNIIKDLEILKIKCNIERTKNIEKINSFTLLKNCVNIEYEKQEEKNNWNNTSFELINNLKCDHSGRVGEKYIYELCNFLNIDNVYYDDDTSTKDGVYDIIINNRKIEVKTARFGINKSFQHENLRNNGCDYYLFIDILQEYFYITILPKFDFSNKNDIIGRKPHLRKGSNNVYKLDLSEKNIKTAINKKYSIKIDSKCNDKKIYRFINNVIK